MAESTSTLYKSVNGNLKEEDFIPASLILTEEDRVAYSEKYNRHLMLYSEIQEVAQKYGIDATKIYFTEYGKGNSNYFYFHFPTLVDITHFSTEHFDMFEFHKSIQYLDDFFKKKMEKEDYETIISLIDNRLRIMAVNKLYDIIPDNQKFTWMMEVYTLEDYGFTAFSNGLIEDAFSKRTEKQKRMLMKKLARVSDEEVLTIYRGQGTESTPLEQTYSWTLSYDVACRFANNFGLEGEVFAAKVNKTDVVDYVTDRKEEEIIARPANIQEIQPMNMVKTKAELEKLSTYFLLERYHSALEEFDENLFFEPYGIHGVLHMKRVLLHVLSLSLELQLDDIETELLIAAAMYHDIGRINDDRDDTHGERSWEKMNTQGILEKLEEEHDFYEGEMSVLRFIVENHCLNDDYVIKQLDKQSFGNYSNADVKNLLFIFKDADGLDRVRLGDLKSRFLRTTEAKRRMNFAEQLLRGVQ